MSSSSLLFWRVVLLRQFLCELQLWLVVLYTFDLRPRDIEFRSNNIVRALKAMWKFSTTSMWVRVKEEDSFHFVAWGCWCHGVSGDMTIIHTGCKEHGRRWSYGGSFNWVILMKIIMDWFWWNFYSYFIERLQHGVGINRNRYSVIHCRILFWMKTGFEDFHPKNNLAKFLLEWRVIVLPLGRQQREIQEYFRRGRHPGRVALPYDPDW